jgi:hypothetical protein
LGASFFAGAWLHAVKTAAASATMAIINAEDLDFIMSFLFDITKIMSGLKRFPQFNIKIVLKSTLWCQDKSNLHGWHVAVCRKGRDGRAENPTYE